jgi:predicted DNA-binding protein with PD1-like motif
MLTLESARSRRLILRLDPGERVHRSLRELSAKAAIGGATVRGRGELRWLELGQFDLEGRRVEPADRIGSCSLLSVEGSLALSEGTIEARLHCAARLPTGEVVGGVLLEAEVLSCELVIEVFDDLLLERRLDPVTGVERLVEVRPPAPASPERVDRAPVSWAAVAAASTPSAGAPAPAAATRAQRRSALKSNVSRSRALQSSTVSASAGPAFVPEPIPERRRMTEEEFFDEPIPEPGDYVDHQVFGVCRVEGEDKDGGLIIRLKTGVRKAIRLDYLQVLEGRIEDDKIIYPLRSRKR